MFIIYQKLSLYVVSWWRLWWIGCLWTRLLPASRKVECRELVSLCLTEAMNYFKLVMWFNGCLVRWCGRTDCRCSDGRILIDYFLSLHFRLKLSLCRMGSTITSSNSSRWVILAWEKQASSTSTQTASSTPSSSLQWESTLEKNEW